MASSARRIMGRSVLCAICAGRAASRQHRAATRSLPAHAASRHAPPRFHAAAASAAPLPRRIAPPLLLMLRIAHAANGSMKRRKRRQKAHHSAAHHLMRWLAQLLKHRLSTYALRCAYRICEVCICALAPVCWRIAVAHSLSSSPVSYENRREGTVALSR